MVKLNLSDKQLSKFRNGHQIQIQPHQIGSGIEVGNLHPMLMQRLQKARQLGKGCRINNEGCDGAGFNIKKSFNKAVKETKKVANSTINDAKKAVNQGVRYADKYGQKMVNEGMDMAKDYANQGVNMAKDYGRQALNEGLDAASSYAQSQSGSGFNVKKSFNKAVKQTGKALKKVNVKNINKGLDSIGMPNLNDIASKAIDMAATVASNAPVPGASLASSIARDQLHKQLGSGLDPHKVYAADVPDSYNRSFQGGSLRAGSLRANGGSVGRKRGRKS